MKEYKNKWQPNSLNKEFWEEVLVGRKIKSLNLDTTGIKSFVLDNDEIIYVDGVTNGYGYPLYIEEK
jgi:hypothetical protein